MDVQGRDEEFEMASDFPLEGLDPAVDNPLPGRELAVDMPLAGRDISGILAMILILNKTLIAALLLVTMGQKTRLEFRLIKIQVASKYYFF